MPVIFHSQAEVAPLSPADLMRQLMNLRQSLSDWSVQADINQFNEIRTRVNLTEQFTMSCFLTGLRSDIADRVLRLHPVSLQRAFSVAKLVEASIILEQMALKFPPPPIHFRTHEAAFTVDVDLEHNDGDVILDDAVKAKATPEQLDGVERDEIDSEDDAPSSDVSELRLDEEYTTADADEAESEVINNGSTDVLALAPDIDLDLSTGVAMVVDTPPLMPSYWAAFNEVPDPFLASDYHRLHVSLRQLHDAFHAFVIIPHSGLMKCKLYVFGKLNVLGTGFGALLCWCDGGGWIPEVDTGWVLTLGVDSKMRVRWCSDRRAFVATYAFSGVHGHVNNSLRKLGTKNIAASIGCGVGFGYGFGIGLAVKPGVVDKIQSCLMQSITHDMTKLSVAPNLSVGQGLISAPLQSGTVKELSYPNQMERMGQFLTSLASSGRKSRDANSRNVSFQELPWGALNEVVMGRVSASTFLIDPTGSENGGSTGLFQGVVSTANNGGFTSARTKNFSVQKDLFVYDKPWMSQLFAVAYLYVAANLEDIQVPLMFDLQVGNSEFVFEAKTIIRMKLLVLSAMQWRTKLVTPVSFFDHIVRRFGLLYTLHREFFKWCECMLISIVADSRLLHRLPSVIAAATVLFGINEIAPDDAMDYENPLVDVLKIRKAKVDNSKKLCFYFLFPFLFFSLYCF